LPPARHRPRTLVGSLLYLPIKRFVPLILPLDLQSLHRARERLVSERWIVERTIAWLNRCRRLAKDWENLNRTALAFLKLASIRLMLRKLCNPRSKFSDGLKGYFTNSTIFVLF
jgi:transposase